MRTRWIAAVVCVVGAAEWVGVRGLAEDRPLLSASDFNKAEAAVAWSTIDPVQFYPPGFNKPFPRDLAEVPLSVLATEISGIIGLPVRINRTALSEAGIPLGTPITRRVAGARIDSLLARVLEDVDGTELAWLIQNEGVLITTREDADTIQVARTINIAPLLDAGYPAAAINRMVLSMTAGPWAEIDGEGGSLRIIGDRLIVRQSFRELTGVQCLLAALESPQPVVAIGRTPADENARAALELKVTGSGAGVPFNRVIQDFAKQVGVTIDLDQTALADAGVGLDEKVTYNAANRPLRVVLNEILEDVGGSELAPIIGSGVMTITTRGEADTIQSVRLYNIAEIAARDESDDFVEMLFEMTDGPWALKDGDGGVIELARPQTLVVRQTERGLRQVDALVAEHRKGTPRPTPQASTIEVRRYQLPAQMAEDLLTAIPKFVAVDKWKDFPDGTSPMIERVSLGNNRAGQNPPVVVTLDNESAPGRKDGDRVEATIRSGNAVLIIRQTHDVHRQIQRFIKDLMNAPAERAPGLQNNQNINGMGVFGCFGGPL